MLLWTKILPLSTKALIALGKCWRIVIYQFGNLYPFLGNAEVWGGVLKRTTTAYTVLPAKLHRNRPLLHIKKKSPDRYTSGQKNREQGSVS